MAKLITVCGLLLVLGMVNLAIIGKEQHLRDGQVVYLALAPVDPRSLMQGDYMALRFALGGDIQQALRLDHQRPRDRRDVAGGYVVVRLDARGVATFVRLHQGTALNEDERLLRYRVRNGMAKLATNAFFFQEGTGPVYANARFGRFRVDDDGELLLTALYDGELQKLVPDAD